MKIFLINILIILVLFVSGCVEEFVLGFGSGAAAMKKLADDAQTNFIETVNELNTKKAEYETLINQIENSDLKNALEALLDEQTTNKLKELGEVNWTDPKVATGYGLALAALLTAGYQKKMRVDGK